MKKRKKRIRAQNVLAGAVALLAAAGVILCIARAVAAGRTPAQACLLLALCCAGLALAAALQIALHEVGHLVFGLLSGYRFSSLRIGSLMLVREEDGLRLRRLSVAGTGGQCLMTPPALRDGRMPVALFNLGGALMNLLTAAAFLALSFAAQGLARALLRLPAVLGAAFALLNGVPMRTDALSNDGENARALRGDREAMRAFWVQLMVSERMARGERLRDMPQDWFAVPDAAGMQSGMTAALGVFACNRLMDLHDFEEADELMARLLRMKSGIAGLHRMMLLCDRLYVALITPGREDGARALCTQGLEAFMDSMKDFPSVLRTQYARALLMQRDAQEAARLRAQFERCARRYPYAGDITSEQELMAIADRCAQPSTP